MSNERPFRWYFGFIVFCVLLKALLLVGGGFAAFKLNPAELLSSDLFGQYWWLAWVPVAVLVLVVVLLPLISLCMLMVFIRKKLPQRYILLPSYYVTFTVLWICILFFGPKAILMDKPGVAVLALFPYTLGPLFELVFAIYMFFAKKHPNTATKPF